MEIFVGVVSMQMGKRYLSDTPSHPNEKENRMKFNPFRRMFNASTKDSQDGATAVTAPDETPIITRDANGNPTCIELDQIKTVGIENIIDVEMYEIHTVAGLKSHYIRFHGGGEVILAYNQTGQCIDFRHKKCCATIAFGGHIMFRRTEVEKS